MNFDFTSSNFSLPQKNYLKLIHNAYYHKAQMDYEIWMASFKQFNSYVTL